MSGGSKRALQRFVACWGNGDFGRLGHGVECLSEEAPRLVSALADMQISHVSAGGAHTAVLAGALRVQTRPALCWSRCAACVRVFPSDVCLSRRDLGLTTARSTARFIHSYKGAHGLADSAGQNPVLAVHCNMLVPRGNRECWIYKFIHYFLETVSEIKIKY